MMLSMDWLKGTSTGNHGFSMVVPLNIGVSCTCSLFPKPLIVAHEDADSSHGYHGFGSLVRLETPDERTSAEDVSDVLAEFSL